MTQRNTTPRRSTAVASAGEAQLQGSTPTASRSSGAPTPTKIAARIVDVVAKATTPAASYVAAPITLAMPSSTPYSWFAASPADAAARSR